MQNASVLFVCLGNICRSPVAEGLLRKHVADAGLSVNVDSAGTGGWHVGQSPHARSKAVAIKNGFDISAHRAQQVRADDWFAHTHVIALDAANMNDLKLVRPDDATAELLQLMRLTDAADKDVLDPYGMTPDAFDDMYAQIDIGVTALLALLTQT